MTLLSGRSIRRAERGRLKAPFKAMKYAGEGKISRFLEYFGLACYAVDGGADVRVVLLVVVGGEDRSRLYGWSSRTILRCFERGLHGEAVKNHLPSYRDGNRISCLSSRQWRDDLL